MDLYLAMGVMAAVSVAAFALAHRLVRGLSRSGALVALLAVITALVFYLQYGQDRLEAVRLLPVSAVVIYANLTPVLAAIAGAITWRAVRPPAVHRSDPTDDAMRKASTSHAGAVSRRVILILMLWGLAAVQAWHVAWAKPPPLGQVRQGLVWRQTTQASCSAAAAATLLGWYGIDSSEAEMARLCLTTRQGTRTLGVYRGLLLKAGDSHTIETYTGPAEGLRDFATSPVLINVGLDPEDVLVDSRYTTDWGWRPGIRHTVVVFAFLPSGQLVVGDPAVGMEFWSYRTLEILWQGEAIKLTPRS